MTKEVDNEGIGTVALIAVIALSPLIWYGALYPKIREADASRAKTAQIDFWDIVAGEKPIPQTPEGELARDLRIVYFEPSTPHQRQDALSRLTHEQTRKKMTLLLHLGRVSRLR